METAGFVLTGGMSSRMGQDKALLPYGEGTLVEHVAGVVRAAAGRVTLIGAPERYYALGLSAVADSFAPCGPLGGIVTALRVTEADWNLVVACDMPAVTVEFLSGLLGEAEGDCVAPVSEDGRMQPLCAVYHRRALERLEESMRNGIYKITAALEGLRVVERSAANRYFANINTPAEWQGHHIER